MTSIKTIAPSERDPYRIVNVVRQLVELQNVAAGSTYTNILNHGGIADGTTDNTAALTAAVAALGTRGGTIYFPQGKYAFLSQQAIAYALNAIFDITLAGDGPDATVLFWPGTNSTFGINVSFNSTAGGVNNQSFHARDLSFTTSSNPVAGTGLTLQQIGSTNGAYCPLTSLTRVMFRGDSGVALSDGWSICWNVVNISNIECIDSIFQGPSPAAGVGIQYGGTDATHVAVVFNCMGTTFNLLTTGFKIANQFTQGLTFTGCNFTTNTNGFNIPNGVGTLNGASVAQVAFANCQFGIPASSIGVSADSTTPIAQLLCSNNLFLPAANGAGVVAPLQNSCITGNTFQATTATGTIGVQVTSNPSNVANIIEANTFLTLGIGILLGSGAFNNSIGPNTFSGCTTNVSNSAIGSHNNYGIWDGSNANSIATHLLRNLHGIAGDVLMYMGAGSTSSNTDSTTDYILFLDPTLATTFGAIRRNNTGMAFDSLSLPVASLTDVAWSTYTPTLTGTTGTAGAANTTTTGRFKQIGKTCLYQVDMTWVNSGSYTGTSSFTLPPNASALVGATNHGRETANTGVAIQVVNMTASNASIVKYDNSNMLSTSDRYKITGFYETT